MRSRKKKLVFDIPHWVATLYMLFAVVLVPWTVYLAITLPRKHFEPRWDTVWVGLDIAIIFLLLLTAILASIKSRLVIISLCATASFILVDSWFDITSSRTGLELNQALFLAIFFEIPIAILGFFLAYKVINKNIE